MARSDDGQTLAKTLFVLDRMAAGEWMTVRLIIFVLMMVSAFGHSVLKFLHNGRKWTMVRPQPSCFSFLQNGQKRIVLDVFTTHNSSWSHNFFCWRSKSEIVTQIIFLLFVCAISIKFFRTMMFSAFGFILWENVDAQRRWHLDWLFVLMMVPAILF